jgi:dihydrofolate reductase
MIGIIAKSLNGVIGLNGKLPWKCSEDLAFFKKTTMNKNIAVGYNTYINLPALIDRNIFVLTSKLNIDGNCTVCNSINDLPNDIIVCGGGKVYDCLLPKCEYIYLSIIKQNVNGDTFFNSKWLDNFSHENIITLINSNNLHVIKLINKNYFNKL